MATKAVLRRQRLGESVIATARVHAHHVDGRLQQTLADVVADGETLPDFLTAQLQLARHLERRLDALVAAEEVYLAELDDDVDPRAQRDEAVESLYRTLSKIRRLMRLAVGSRRAQPILGLEGDTPRREVPLLQAAKRAATRLEGRAEALSDQRVTAAGLEVDLSALAAELRPRIDELERALAETDRERDETVATRRRRDDAKAAFDRALRGVVRTLRGWYQLAGCEELIGRLRLRLSPPPPARAA